MGADTAVKSGVEPGLYEQLVTRDLQQMLEVLGDPRAV